MKNDNYGFYAGKAKDIDVGNDEVAEELKTIFRMQNEKKQKEAMKYALDRGFKFIAVVLKETAEDSVSKEFKGTIIHDGTILEKEDAEKISKTIFPIFKKGIEEYNERNKYEEIDSFIAETLEKLRKENFKSPNPELYENVNAILDLLKGTTKCENCKFTKQCKAYNEKGGCECK